jgi:ATP-binding cassette subfamily F protein 3
VLTISGLSKAFGENVLFENLDMEIKRGEHVSLIGGNGTGKTTILKLINRVETKTAGTITLGARVRIGYYDQEHQVLSFQKTIFDEISDSYPELTNTQIRNVLAAFLFTGDDVFKKIGDLSGGERGRVSLAKLMLSPANFLILDEPTNHLDIQSKEILEEAIRNYTGTVLVVSHDRYFINAISSRIIELKDKKLYSFIGNYDYYEAHKELVYASENQKGNGGVSLNGTGVTAPTASSSREEYLKNKEEQAKIRKKENEIKRVEAAIEKLEEEISAIDDEINDPVNATNSHKLGELSAKRQECSDSLDELMEKWEELSS